jgi:hypothetical protein
MLNSLAKNRISKFDRFIQRHFYFCYISEWRSFFVTLPVTNKKYKGVTQRWGIEIKMPVPKKTILNSHEIINNRPCNLQNSCAAALHFTSCLK